MPCRVCHGERLEMFLDLGDQPHCDSLLRPEDLPRREPYYPLQVCFCHDCTTVQINYTVPKETMFGEYLYVSGTTETLRRHFRESTDRLVTRLNLLPGDLVVDIGSNDGTWLACYQKYGLRTLGVDGAKNLAAMANARGIETWARFFNAEVARDIIAAKGHAKLVTAAGVFFHLEELHSVTQGIAELIRDDGVFCVQAISLVAMLQHNQFDQVYHEHLTYWTVHSLDRLFEQYGLEIFHAGKLPIHGGSMELLVAPKGKRPVNASVDAMRAEEDRLGCGRIETYHEFARRVREIERELMAILRDYARRGKTVHAFGAPAKGATLLNSFHITTDLVQCAVEVNPLKIGKYIPGCRLPILDEAKTPPPDAYLLLAWNFLKEFLPKKRDFILAGGEFIVPIPRPVIINRHNYEQFVG
ncbi:MAG: class I SAM-dependent methyltransferase [Verrucomicrobiales bacterium]|nr:class I SAM-dependent methyltransferase [Verrucomicrobiales bacterium]